MKEKKRMKFIYLFYLFFFLLFSHVHSTPSLSLHEEIKEIETEREKVSGVHILSQDNFDSLIDGAKNILVHVHDKYVNKI